MNADLQAELEAAEAELLILAQQAKDAYREYRRLADAREEKADDIKDLRRRMRATPED